MKTIATKTTSLTAGIVLLAVAGGVVLASQHPSQKPVVTLKTTADTAQAVSTGSSASTAPTSTQTAPTTSTAPVSTTTTPTDTSSTSQTTSSTPAGTTTTTDTTTPPPAPAPVTAVSATIDDWTTPQAEVNDNQNVLHSQQYCTFGYSDGTTKDELLSDKYDFKNGTIGIIRTAIGCVVSDAPAAN